MRNVKISNLKYAALAGALALVMLTGCGRGSDDEVTAFFQNIAHGDQSEASAQFSPELRKKFPQSAFDDALLHWTKEMLAHGGLKDINLSGGVVSYNALALYDVVLIYNDGKTKALKTSLIHNGDNWYINSAL
ncbi:MAG: hypothetical protein ACOH12_11580 [Parvibaculaceae bacterium]